jgi:hypothetical protein
MHSNGNSSSNNNNNRKKGKLQSITGHEDPEGEWI